MGKKSKKSGSSSSNSQKTEIQEPTFGKIEKVESSTKVIERELTIGEKKLLREQEKQKKYEEEERQRKSRTSESEKKTKTEKKGRSSSQSKKTELLESESPRKVKRQEDQQRVASVEREKNTKSDQKKKKSEDKDTAEDEDKSYTKLNYNEPKKQRKTSKEDISIEQNDTQTDSWEEKNDADFDNVQNKDSKFNSEHRSSSRYNDSSSKSRYNSNQDWRKQNTDDNDQYDSWRSNKNSSKDQGYRERNQSKYDNYRNKENRSEKYNKYDRDNREEASSDQDFDHFMYKVLDKGSRDNFVKVKEISGDLFTAPAEFSLGHCVAEDFSMGAGIALQFRKQFGKVAYLIDQRAKTGGLAVLEDKDRFIYYLVTKKMSYSKPTMLTLWKSLCEVRKHMVENKVTKLAIPEIGCGLDRLDWGNVKQMLEYVFKDVDAQIAVYSLNYGQTPDSQTSVKRLKGRRVNAPYPLVEIQSGTGLIFFGTEDSHITDEIKSLETKYSGLISFYQREKKSLGDVIRYEQRNNDVIYGFIIKRKIDENIIYNNLEKCCLLLRKMNKKDQYEYFGFDAPYNDLGNLGLEKFINVITGILNDCNIYICWPSNIREFMPTYEKS